MALTGLSSLIIGMVDLAAPALIAIASIGGFFFGAMLPARDMILRAATPAGAFGKVFGFVTNGFNIAGILAPPLFGAMLDHGASPLFFYTVTAFGIASVVSVACVPRRPPAP